MAWPPKRIRRVSPVSAAGAGFTGAASTGRSVPRGTPKGAAGNTRRYFPFKLLVPPEAERAVSVFVYVDLGHKTTTALRSWRDVPHGLWNTLRERGRSIEVVAGRPDPRQPGAGPHDP